MNANEKNDTTPPVTPATIDPIAEELDRAGVEPRTPVVVTGEQLSREFDATNRRNEQAAASKRQCPKCDALTMRAVAFDSEVRQCETCGARVAYGELMPRIVVKPYENDRRLVVVTIFDQNVANSDGSPSSEPAQVVVDRGLAKLWASALFSMGV